MTLDRVVIGQHANTTHIGPGLFVSQPGANVMHPEYAQFGNLMFDSSEPHSTLSIIQSGTFKITCKRQSFSPRGENIGARKADTFEIQRMVHYSGGQPDVAGWTVGYGHTFYQDTERPAALTPIANSLFGASGTDMEDPGNIPFIFTPDLENPPPEYNSGDYTGKATMSAGARTVSKQGNYLDKGTHTFAITNPLPDGEIPEVALRFAVGTDEYQTNPYTETIGPTFHPWYANTKTTGEGGSWSDIDEWAYLDSIFGGTAGTANSQQIVHMDSNWMRLKWGGLGAEEYRGIQDEYNFDALLDFFGDAQSIVDKFGFVDEADARAKLDTNSKLLSLAVTNAQGIVGLIPYVNATSITVDAYMTPTHSGLRQPIDRTFQINAGKQKGIGFNVIDDFAHINFPIEHHPHTNRFWHFDRVGVQLIDPNQAPPHVAGHFPPNFHQAPAHQGTGGAESHGYPPGDHTHYYTQPGYITGSYPSTVTSYPFYTTYADWYYVVKHRLHAKLFKELPGIPEVGNMFNDKSKETIMSPINEPDHGKRDMYGWGGHPTEFFVNPFSNANLTFYTHMQPPYIRLGGDGTYANGFYTGQYLPLNYTNETSSAEPYWQMLCQNPKGFRSDGLDDKWMIYGNYNEKNAHMIGYFPHQTNDPNDDASGTTWTGTGFPQRSRSDIPETFTPGASSWTGWGPSYPVGLSGGYPDPEGDPLDNERIWWFNAPLWKTFSPSEGSAQNRSETQFTFHGGSVDPSEIHFTHEGDSAPPNSSLYTQTLHGGAKYDDLGMWGTAWMPMPGTFNGAGIKWPAGHPRADFLDHRDWIGSMGLAGAGSKESLAAAVTPNATNVWDTFYVSYVVYSTGSVPPTSAQAMGAGASSASPSSANKVSQVNVWDAYWGSGKPGSEVKPSIINNLVFPDDLVGTVGDPASDPFASNRDPLGKIYGNMHFDLILDEGKNYGSDKFDSITRIPLPAITLDFSEDKWNFQNNNDSISLSIKNSSRIVGGGGSGGVGTRRRVTVTKSGDVSDAAHGGGGGGAGGGTGRNPLEQTMIGSVGYNGTGWGGDGWGRGLLSLGEFDYGDEGSVGSKFDGPGVGGSKAVQTTTTNIDTDTWTTQINFYGKGGDGGDVFHVKHPSTIQPTIGIENSNTGVIIAGGGAGAGGYEVDGGDGGSYGNHGESTYGSVAFWGGNPGYIVSSPDNTYTTPVRITNINNGIVQGRNPDLSSHDTSNTSGGIAGGWLLTGNNTEDSSLEAIKKYR